MLPPAFCTGSFLVSGSVSACGLVAASGRVADGTEAVDLDEVSGVGLPFAWLSFSDKGADEPARLGLGLGTLPPSLWSSSAPALWAA